MSNFDDRYVILGVILFPAIMILFEFINGSVNINPYIFGAAGLVLFIMSITLMVILYQEKYHKHKFWPVLLNYLYFMFNTEKLLKGKYFKLGSMLRVEKGIDEVYIDCSESTSVTFDSLILGYSLRFAGIKIHTFDHDPPVSDGDTIITDVVFGNEKVIHSIEGGNIMVTKYKSS